MIILYGSHIAFLEMKYSLNSSLICLKDIFIPKNTILVVYMTKVYQPELRYDMKITFGGHVLFLQIYHISSKRILWDFEYAKLEIS